jgi:hypothetical protein
LIEIREPNVLAYLVRAHPFIVHPTVHSFRDFAGRVACDAGSPCARGLKKSGADGGSWAGVGPRTGSVTRARPGNATPAAREWLVGW